MTASKNLAFSNDNFPAPSRLSVSARKASHLWILNVESMLTFATASSLMAVAFYLVSNFLGA